MAAGRGLRTPLRPTPMRSLPSTLRQLLTASADQVPAALDRVATTLAATTPSFETVGWLASLFDADETLPSHLVRGIRAAFADPSSTLRHAVEPHLEHLRLTTRELTGRVVADPVGAPLHPETEPLLHAMVADAVAAVWAAGGEPLVRSYAGRYPEPTASRLLARAEHEFTRDTAHLTAQLERIQADAAAGTLAYPEAERRTAAVQAALDSLLDRQAALVAVAERALAARRPRPQSSDAAA